MNTNSKRYILRLHIGDQEQAFCAKHLDDIRNRIKSGDLKKGALSQEIFKAVYKHFSLSAGTPQVSNSTPKCSQTIRTSAASSSNGLNDAFRDVGESDTDAESSGDLTDSYSATDSLLSLSKSFKKGGD